MVQWRNRGFVQDSDDEDIDLDKIDSQNSNLSTAAGQSLPRTASNVSGSIKDTHSVFPLVQAQNITRELPHASASVPLLNLYHNDSSTGVPTLGEGGEESPPSQVVGNYIERGIHQVSRDVATARDDNDIDELQAPHQPSSYSIYLRTPPNAVLTGSRNHEPNVFDVPSSPLSDAPSDIEQEHSAHNLRENLRPTTPDIRPSPPSSPLIPEPEVLVFHVARHEDHNNVAGRIFRRRNPIQLHPYLLEQEQYRKTLRSRGVRPVAVASSPHQQHHEAQEQESQFRDVPGEVGSQLTGVASSPPQSSPSLDALRDELQDDDDARGIASDSDELPNLSSALNATLVTAEKRGFKRRKVLQTYSRTSGHHTYPQNPSARAAHPPQALMIAMQDEDLLDQTPTVGPTETPQMTTKQKLRSKKFRVPKGLAPAELPTPQTSSQSAKMHLPLFPHLSDSDSSDEQRAIGRLPRDLFSRLEHRQEETPNPAQLEMTESSASETEELRKVSHRLKGVLPASWLRLDQQANPRKVQEQSIGSPARNQSQRGIAQRVDHSSRSARSTPQLPTPALTTIIDVSDDSLPSSWREKAGTREPLRNAYKLMNRQAASHRQDFQEIQEENFIDPMLPTATRKPKARHSTKRQLKLNDTFGRGNTTSSRRQGREVPAVKISDVQPARKEQRKPIPKLCILDSASLPQVSARPDFLRIAMRDARSKPDNGRHSPKWKIAQMQDRRNDTDVQSTLQSWRRGRISQRRNVSSASGSIHAYIEGHVVQQRLSSPVRERLVTLKHAVKSTATNRQERGSGSIQQSRLEPRRVVEAKPLIKHGSVRCKGLQKPTARSHVESLHIAMPGQLEVLQPLRLRRDRRVASYSSRTNQVPRGAHISQEPFKQSPNIMLERFLQQDQDESPTVRLNPQTSENVQQKSTITRRQRKRTPQRLNIQDADMDLVSSPIALPASFEDTSVRSSTARGIEGLGSFGTFYTTDFDIEPLPVGLSFAANTFIGSGEFSKAVSCHYQDQGLPSHSSTEFEFGRVSYKWAAWTEEVSTQLMNLLSGIAPQDSHVSRTPADMTAHMLHASSVLRAIVKYLAVSLHFLDAIDRSSFSQRIRSLIKDLAERMILLTTNQATSNACSSKASLRPLTYLSVLASQGYWISVHPLVDAKIKLDIEQVLRMVLKQCARHLLNNGLLQTRALHSRAATARSAEAGITDTDIEVESLVVHHHLLAYLRLSGLDFTDFVNVGMAPCSIASSTRISVFDSAWHDIFALLPLLEIDTCGIVRRLEAPASELGNVSVVVASLSRIFELYQSHLLDQTRPINPYIRAVLGRCFVVISKWGWRKCEGALSTIFNFFAGAGFAMLRNEEATDSPKFLRELDKRIRPALEIGDRSFDIYLKAMFIGLRGLELIYSHKKIRNIAWRFIPNHGRQHERGNMLRPSDLQALRNTHDLLAVLYAASPAGSRPNIDLIRNLANFVSSHAEVCKLNARCWSNLARYQLSTEEGLDALGPFVSWLNEMFRQLLGQHRQARTEAQAQFDRSHSTEVQLSTTLMEATVASNQRQIENVLICILASLTDLVRHAAKDNAVLTLIEQSALPEVLNLLSTEGARVHNVLIAALEVYEAAYVRMRSSQPKRSNVVLQQDSNEDSQDFGDFPDIDDMDEVLGVENLQQCDRLNLFEPVQQHLSNCFGTELDLDEKLLNKTIDVWARGCDVLVFRHEKDWAYFLDPQSSGSWHQLRESDVKRKYLPYLATRLVILAPTIIEENDMAVMSVWLGSLVERESVLKHQHRLTAALLDACPSHPLLANLPFAKQKEESKYSISFADLSQARLALISSILANMRSSLDSSILTSATNTQRLRLEYKDLLKQMMFAMKKNYQEIQQGNIARGSYVDFVQNVIEALQQYTSEICQVDKFFTDSSAFPLPVTDPTYVVGRLRSYGLKANDVREQKKLAIFFQAVCERAAVDNHQVYLVDQLRTAVRNDRESGESGSLTLRGLLIQGIFPAYLETAFHKECGWILAIPILEALSYMLDDLLPRFSVCDDDSRRTVASMVVDLLISLRAAFAPLVADPNLLGRQQLVATLSVAYSVIRSAAPIVDYVHRSSIFASDALDSLNFFRSFGQFVIDQLQSQDECHPPSDLLDTASSTVQVSLAAIRVFCKDELARVLRDNWSKQEDDYYVTRNGARRQIELDVGELEEESSNTVAAIRDCLRAVDRLPSCSPERGWPRLALRFRDAETMI